MVKVDSINHSDYISFAEQYKCGTVYPLSVAEGYQQGDIFVNSISDCRTVLFWHYSGFAFVSGRYDESFLDSVYDILSANEGKNPRRCILFTDNELIKAFFSDKDNIEIERRFFFEHTGEFNGDVDLPSGCELKIIDRNIISEINGRITPRFSWNNEEDFLSKGNGYCIVANGEVAAWAFSAAVSDTEIDIGVETSEKYQHRGYAAIVSNAMIKNILQQNKKPVWACHYKNIASVKLAEKIGFNKTAECFVIKKLK